MPKSSNYVNDDTLYNPNSKGEFPHALPRFILEYGKSLNERTRNKIAIIFVSSRRTVQSLRFAESSRNRAEIPPPISVGQDTPAQLIEQLLRLTPASTDPANDLYLRSLANIYWVHTMARNSTSSPPEWQHRYPGLSDSISGKVQKFMRLHLASRIEVSDMADVAQLSPSHFRRAFQISLGMPPHQFLLKLRIEAAERLLRGTDLTLAAIARQCGFANEGHVTKVMRQHRGATPSAIREAYREQSKAEAPPLPSV